VSGRPQGPFGSGLSRSWSWSWALQLGGGKGAAGPPQFGVRAAGLLVLCKRAALLELRPVVLTRREATRLSQFGAPSPPPPAPRFGRRGSELRRAEAGAALLQAAAVIGPRGSAFAIEGDGAAAAQFGVALGQVSRRVVREDVAEPVGRRLGSSGIPAPARGTVQPLHQRLVRPGPRQGRSAVRFCRAWSCACCGSCWRLGGERRRGREAFNAWAGDRLSIDHTLGPSGAGGHLKGQVEPSSTSPSWAPVVEATQADQQHRRARLPRFLCRVSRRLSSGRSPVRAPCSCFNRVRVRCAGARGVRRGPGLACSCSSPA